jgi:aspartyl protease family protein
VNDGSQALNLIYLLIILIAVVAAFSVRRVPVGKTLKMAFAWVLIFVAGFAIFALREDFKALGVRLWAAVTGATVQETQNGELRIAMAEDGHFWVEGELNGHSARFLVDSGATVTTIGRQTAAEAGIAEDGRRAPVSTANGVVLMGQGRAERLKLGPIERSDFPMFIAQEDNINVLGMNFLSSLSRWSVEGRTLVLRP